MGLGMILGGAMSGLGQGIAQQGMSDAEQRRTMALEGLRQQNALALEDRRSSNQREEIKTTAGEQRTTQAQGAKLDDWKDSRKTARDTSSTITVDNNRSKNAERISRVEIQLRQSGEQANIRLADELKRAAAAGEVTDTIQDSQGNYYAVMKDGSRKPLDVQGVVKTGGNSIFQDLGTAPGPTAAPSNRPPLSSFGG